MFYASKYSIHKGKAALQVSPIPPTWSPEDPKGNSKVIRDGAFFVEMAAIKGKDANGNNTYNWAADQKIGFSLGIPDLEALKVGLMNGAEVKRTHVNGSEMKVFTVAPGQNEGTWSVSLQLSAADPVTKKKIASDKDRRISIYLSDGECMILFNSIFSMVPQLLGWDVAFRNRKVDSTETKYEQSYVREDTDVDSE